MRRQQTQATEVHAYVRIEEFKELKCYLSLFSIWLFARPRPPSLFTLAGTLGRPHQGRIEWCSCPPLRSTAPSTG